MTSVHSRHLPAVYAAVGEQYNPDYSLFKLEVAEFCDDATDAAKQVIASSGRHITINDLLPKMNFKIFGIFSSTTENGDKRETGEMDGVTRAFSVIVGGLVAGLASFVFGKFYWNYNEATERLEKCEQFKSTLPEIWQIRGHNHSAAVKFIVDSEESLARAEKRSAMINMAMTVGVIASGAILIVAGLFASVPLAITGAVAGAGIGVAAMAKFGMNFFDKTPARKAAKILEKINELKNSHEIEWVQRVSPFERSAPRPSAL